jgi:hypothetical protein
LGRENAPGHAPDMHVRHCKVLSGPEGVGYKEEVSMEANLTALTKIAVVFLGVAFAQGAVAQETSDIEKVKAASQAFYAALNARDPSAMAKV